MNIRSAYTLHWSLLAFGKFVNTGKWLVTCTALLHYTAGQLAEGLEETQGCRTRCRSACRTGGGTAPTSYLPQTSSSASGKASPCHPPDTADPTDSSSCLCPSSAAAPSLCASTCGHVPSSDNLGHCQSRIHVEMIVAAGATYTSAETSYRCPVASVFRTCVCVCA